MQAIAALFFFPIALICLGVLVRAIRARRYLVLVITLLPCIGEGYLIGASYWWAHYWDGVEFNPRVSAEDVAGTWRFEDKFITFAKDGTFTAFDGSHGNWTAAGLFQVKKDGPTRGGQDSVRLVHMEENPWVLIRRSGELLVLHPPAGDPDTWDKSRAFRKQGGAATSR